MPARLRHRVDAMQVTAVGAGESAVDPSVLAALGDVVRAREVLRFDHPGDERTRRVEPHHLVTRGGRWYLVAWDLDRGDWRTFRADRITPRMPTGPRFTPREVPGGDVGAFVTARFRGGSPEWPCRGEVVLAVPAGAVVPFAGDGVVEDLGSGRCRLVAGSWSWIGLAAGLARFDAEIEVVGPPELAEAFDALARRCARAARPA